MRPIVSVVTPFYNSGEFLEECILSVLRQTFGEFEYILANNRSSDNSLDIALAYANSDPRVRVIDADEFLGQVPNYNRALRQISPESTYCKIVQADDWIYPNCLEQMVALADSDSSVGLVSSYRLKGSQVSGAGLPHTRQVFPGDVICRLQLLKGRYFFGSPTTVMYRSEIVRSRSPFFDEHATNDDTHACYEILKQWRFGFVHQILSFTRVDNESIMSDVRDFNPHLLDKLILVRKFGRDYLDPDEFRTCWSDIESRYLRFLAEAMVRNKGSDFWKHHRRGLATIGYRLSRTKLAWHFLLYLADLVLNPKRTAEELLQKLRSNSRTGTSSRDII